MNVLLIGGGGREHAIAWKLSESKSVRRLFCAPGNGGIRDSAECVDVKATDVPALVAFAKRERIDFTVVGPDDPLVMGVVDAFREAGLRIFGPSKAAAALEGSKSFAKAFMRRHSIPTADYAVFHCDQYREALDYVRARPLPVVVKADGLSLGKGVLICNNSDEAADALRQMMDEKKFGGAGETVLVEECLTGPELTLLSFCDGKTARPMVSAQDYKRALDDDMGLNTGGMGAVSPSPYYTAALEVECTERILGPTLRGMAAEGRPFTGVLYSQLMLTEHGPKVIEFNCRFGDPEAQVVLARLKTNLLEILLACEEGRLHTIEPQWRSEAAVCVVLASGGYPVKYGTGYPIRGLASAEGPDEKIFHAGTVYKDGEHFTSGGRVLGATALGQDIADARQRAYALAERIGFQDVHYRKDIGSNQGVTTP